MSATSKKEKSKGKSKGLWCAYDYDYKSGRVTLKSKKCPRCGKVMAQHQTPQRLSCGGCGYTEYVRKQQEKT